MNCEKSATYKIWSEREVCTLLEAVAQIGTRWKEIEIRFFPYRKVNAIENKFNKMLKAREIEYCDGILAIQELKPELFQQISIEADGESQQLQEHRRRLEEQYEHIKETVSTGGILREKGLVIRDEHDVKELNAQLLLDDLQNYFNQI